MNRDLRAELVSRTPLVNDHPDVAGLLRQGDILARLGPALADPFRGSGITVVMAPEARGPIVGALVALELHAGLVLARKEGQNHPGADITTTSAPTWRGTSQKFVTRSFDLDPTDRVLVVDDWITTGNSIRAVAEVIANSGALYVGCAAIVDKATQRTRDDLNAHTLVDFAELIPAP
jgi:adenine phosphoribosyltransferase